MSTFNGTPIPLGQIQTSYSDQMASAVEGQLVNESDINLTDSVLVSSAGDIGCGLGVVATISTTGPRAGVNDTQISLPTAGKVAADFAGIVVRPKSAFSNGANSAVIRSGFGAMLLDAKRVGGRIWAKCYGGCAVGGKVYWRVNNSITASLTPVGALCGAAISGVAPATYATGTVTFSVNPSDGHTLTLNGYAYRFKTTMAATGDVQLGASLAATMAALVNTVNNTGVSGTDYYAGTTVPNADVSVAQNGLALTVTAKTLGTAGNSLTMAKSSAAITLSGATLAGGVAASTPTDTVELTNAVWKTTASDGQIAKVQLG